MGSFMLIKTQVYNALIFILKYKVVGLWLGGIFFNLKKDFLNVTQLQMQSTFPGTPSFWAQNVQLYACCSLQLENSGWPLG